MRLEKEIIQHKGFRNIVKDGKTIGFQVGIRQPVYRGTWLSQFRFDHITIDGAKYGTNDVAFLIAGIEYTYDEMADQDRIMWPIDEPAYIRVMKQDGLTTGVHAVHVNFWVIRSYLPKSWEAREQEHNEIDPKMKRELILV